MTTTDTKTTDTTTPAHLSAARLAEIRERVAAGKFEHTMSDRAALLAHIDALTPRAAPDGEAHRLAHKLRDPKFYTARTKRAVNSLTVERGPKVVPHE